MAQRNTHMPCSSEAALRRRSTSAAHSERGVAIVLVLFIVALCSVLVTQMTYTSTLDTSLHLMNQRTLQAEYLGKSAINFGRMMLKFDPTPVDHKIVLEEPWSLFYGGTPVDPALLGVQDPAVRVVLQIQADDAKLPIFRLRGIRPDSTDQLDLKWFDAFVEFFRNQGFDSDDQEDGTGLFPGRVFNAEEVVVNLIDYQDSDDTDWQHSSYPSTGIESQVPQGAFKNDRITDIAELYSVPGFNGERVFRVQNYLRNYVNQNRRNINFRLNLNLVGFEVLRSLHPLITEEIASAIIAEREAQPFGVNLQSQLNTPNLLDPNAGEVASFFRAQSTDFMISVWVDYGASKTFVVANVYQEQPGELPVIEKLEIY